MERESSCVAAAGCTPKVGTRLYQQRMLARSLTPNVPEGIATLVPQSLPRVLS
jgi:hypothetical protein